MSSIFPRFVVLLAVSAGAAVQALAQPLLQIEPRQSGLIGDIDPTPSFLPSAWSVLLTPATPAGSLDLFLAMEFQYDVVASSSNPSVKTEFDNAIPGADPFSGGTTTGVALYDDVTSVVSTNPGVGVDTTDGLYAALRSVDLGAGGAFEFPIEALSVAEALPYGVARGGTVYYEAVVEQGGGADAGGFTEVFSGVVEIPTVACLIGDVGCDGDIDGDDLIAVQTEFGKTAPPGTPLLGDADYDSDVDGDDLIAVQSGFGNTASVSVPEPTTTALSLLVAAWIVARRRIA